MPRLSGIPSLMYLEPPPTSVIFQFEQLAQLERIKNEELCPTLLKVFNVVKAGDSV